MVRPGELRGAHGEVVDGRRLGQRVTGDDVAQRVEEEAQPGPAGVDHARLGEHRQLLGRVLERHAGGVACAAHEPGEVRRPLGALRRGASDGEDRALDGTDHRLARHAVGARERLGERRGDDDLVVPERLGDPAQELGEDHPRVAARAHERAVRDGLADLGHASPRPAARGARRRPRPTVRDMFVPVSPSGTG